MKFENPHTNITPESRLDTLREECGQRLDTILKKELTVENIEVFADEALSETVQLIDDILVRYKNNSEFNYDTALSGKQKEDYVFKTLGMPDMQEILQSIINKKEEIDGLKIDIEKQIQKIGKNITPPQPDHHINEGSGQGMEQKKMFPRLWTLAYILKHDFDILPGAISVTEGIVTPDMIRQTPYIRVEIPDLERTVYICDEAGNVSYIFDTHKLKEQNLTIEEIDVDDKGDKNSLISRYPGIGIRLMQSSKWRMRVSKALGEPIPETQEEMKIQEAREGEENVSEFKRERVVWMFFEDFQDKVRELFLKEESPEKVNIKKWYREKRKNHKNWPTNPDVKYKDTGWVGWPELVERENRFKKEFLGFEDFQKEVRELFLKEEFPEKESIKKWYQEKREKHKNWPSDPDVRYKNTGWVGWSELVGRENPLNKKFLGFEDFQDEVRKLYPGEGNVQEWYDQERKNHKNWPSDPNKKYKDTGWLGWPELVGRENRFKKEFLGFEDFQKEVRELFLKEEFPEKVNVQKWYWEERKNHKNWPRDPNVKYKDTGWVGWSELVDRENLFKKEFLGFNDFQDEVRKLYPGKGDVQRWFKEERKNHKNWPSAPDVRYKNSGWVGWSELVGRESLFKKEFLDFEDFQYDVRKLYPGQGNIWGWYNQERKNHENWPSQPHITYKNTGWVGFPELVGRENRFKKIPEKKFPDEN